MPTSLLVEDIWPRITKLCKTGRAFVAVAFIGKSGRKLLPLMPGSVLVVNASEACVKAGQTCPAELMKFVRAGVDVHSAPDLHAKVFAFPKSVLIGSTNVSQNSAKHWQEAAALSTDASLIKGARDFVRDLAGEPLPVARLKQLAKIYQPPKGGPSFKGAHRKRVAPPERSPLWIDDLERYIWDDAATYAAKLGRPRAKAKLRDDQELDEFESTSGIARRLKPGHQLVQVVSEGKRVTVAPVGTVLATRVFRRAGNRRGAIVYLAVPEGRRGIALARAKKLVGRGSKMLSADSGLRVVRDAATAQAIRQLWRPR